MQNIWQQLLLRRKFKINQREISFKELCKRNHRNRLKKFKKDNNLDPYWILILKNTNDRGSKLLGIESLSVRNSMNSIVD